MSKKSVKRNAFDALKSSDDVEKPKALPIEAQQAKKRDKKDKFK
jgi:hypothetical protein